MFRFRAEGPPVTDRFLVIAYIVVTTVLLGFSYLLGQQAPELAGVVMGLTVRWWFEQSHAFTRSRALTRASDAPDVSNGR